jgi:uncharacterized membrane protein
VVVFNNGDSPIRVKITTQTPLGVKFLLPGDDFTIAAGEQKRLDIGIKASSDAVPGEYTLALAAEAYREGTGIKVTGGSQQEAALSIMGESGKVIITIVT